MNRSDYFAFLRETSEKVFPLMLDHVERVRDINAELYDAVMFLVSRKLAKPSLKAALLRLSYEACGGGEWETVIPGAAAFEFLNISSYQANAAFDDKLGVLGRSEKDSQFIASMITREMAFEVAARLKDRWGEGIAREAQAALSESNRCIYVAQHYDLNLLSVRNLERYRDESLFRKHYVERCRYGSGVFTAECARVGGILAGAPTDWLAVLRGFGEEFGTAVQIVNDLGDFLPSEEDDRLARSFQDRFSDFKNGRLTAPLYHVLMFEGHEASEKVQGIMERCAFDDKSLLEVTRLLIREGAFSYAAAIARQAAKRARAHARVLPDGTSKALLLTMLSMIQSNKYLVGLRKITEAFSPAPTCRATLQGTPGYR